AAGAVLMMAVAMPAMAHQAEEKVTLDIPAQSLESALRAFGSETSSQVMFLKEAVAGRKTKALQGTYAPAEALGIPLKGTNLHAEQNAEHVFLIKGPEARSKSTAPATEVPTVNPIQTAAAQPTETAASRGEEGKNEIEEIVVTGTHIRGASPIGSPV